MIKSTSIDLAFLSSLLESAIALKLNENEWLAKSCSSTTHTKENHQASSQMCVSRRVWHLGIFTVWPVYKFEHSFNQKRLCFLPTSTHLSCNHYWYCLVPSLLENEQPLQETKTSERIKKDHWRVPAVNSSFSLPQNVVFSSSGFEYSNGGG